MLARRETWGQPPISQYVVETDEQGMYATAMYDPYGELGCSNIPYPDMLVLTDEDVEDVAIYMKTRDETPIPWEQVKEELARDGLL